MNKKLIWILVSLFLVFPVFSDTNIPTDVSIYYAFDDNILDSVGGDDLTDDGTFTYTTNFAQYPVSGSGAPKAGLFDSTGDNINFPATNFTAVDTSGDNWAVAGWFNATINTTKQYIIDARTAKLYWMVTIDNQGTDMFECGINDGTTKYAQTTDYPQGTYFHFACVRNGTQLNLYINGVLKDSTGGIGKMGTAGQVKIYFSNNGGGDFDYLGMMDSLGIWGRNLTSREVSTLYQTGTLTDVLQSFGTYNSTFNMTSDGGCINWRNDQSSPCNTTDGTPTVIFGTNEAGFCSLRNITGGWNPLFNCSTTGGFSHVCTIFNQDKLTFGSQSLYASCNTTDSSSNYQTGPLAINMTAGGGVVADGLISCISIVGNGCAAVIANNCAAIIK